MSVPAPIGGGIPCRTGIGGGCFPNPPLGVGGVSVPAPIGGGIPCRTGIGGGRGPAPIGGGIPSRTGIGGGLAWLYNNISFSA